MQEVFTSDMKEHSGCFYSGSFSQLVRFVCVDVNIVTALTCGPKQPHQEPTVQSPNELQRGSFTVRLQCEREPI